MQQIVTRIGGTGRAIITACAGSEKAYEDPDLKHGAFTYFALKALKSLPAYADTPIIMLTTESSEEMKNKGRAARATGWMVKPFDPNRLLEVVRKFVN